MRNNAFDMLEEIREIHSFGKTKPKSQKLNIKMQSPISEIIFTLSSMPSRFKAFLFYLIF